MTLARLSLLALAALASVGCEGKPLDSAIDDTCGQCGGGSTDEDSPEPDPIDSCYLLEPAICYELVSYNDTEAWCDQAGADQGVTALYAQAPCDDGADVVGECAIPADASELFEHEATAYYYAPTHDAGSAEALCDESGGQFFER